MTGEPTFTAVLLHDAEHQRDRVVELTDVGRGTPPIRIRVPTTFAGAPAWDVYEIISADGWPKGIRYRHASIEPRTEARLSPVDTLTS